MNIDDVKEIKVKGDKLEAIFIRQKELMNKYHKIEAKSGLMQTDKVPVDIDSPAGQARLKDFAWRITEEIGEAMNCLKQKPWKQTHMETDVVHYLEEIIDAFHFFIELCILSGLTADDLCIFYFKKSEVNKFRQRSNY